MQMPIQNRELDAVGLFVQQAARVQLLTPDQEIYLGRDIQAAIAIVNTIAGILDNPSNGIFLPQCSWEEIAPILRKGFHARSRMVQANLRLVISIASKAKRSRNCPRLELCDLLQEGVLGLHRAAERFDPAKGYKFSTYATWWIRQAVQQAIEDESNTVRIPRYMHTHINKINRTILRMQSTSIPVTIARLAKACDLSPTVVERALNARKRELSLDSFSIPVERLTRLDHTGARHSEIEDVQLELSFLSVREQEVLYRRYFSSTDCVQPFRKIASDLGLSPGSISKTEQNAISKLRKKFESVS